MSQIKLNRIAIIGLPGSGKSTFAHFIAIKIGIPVFHLDKYIYGPGWIQHDKEAIISIQKMMTNKKKWIIDGNNIPSLELRYSAADLVLYLKYPKLVCSYRLLKRFLWKDVEIEDRAEGCKERLEWWLIKYIWEFDKIIDPVLQNLANIHKNTRLIIVKSDSDLSELKKNLISGNLN
jgi:adenylate kinase family enzyme